MVLPVSGHGIPKDGNTRPFFEKPKVSSELSGVDEEILRRSIMQVHYRMTQTAPPTSQVHNIMTHTALATSQVHYRMTQTALPASQVHNRMTQSAPPTSQVHYRMKQTPPPASQVHKIMTQTAPPASPNLTTHSHSSLHAISLISVFNKLSCFSLHNFLHPEHLKIVHIAAVCKAEHSWTSLLSQYKEIDA